MLNKSLNLLKFQSSKFCDAESESLGSMRLKEKMVRKHTVDRYLINTNSYLTLFL